MSIISDNSRFCTRRGLAVALDTVKVEHALWNRCWCWCCCCLALRLALCCLVLPLCSTAICLAHWCVPCLRLRVKVHARVSTCPTAIIITLEPRRCVLLLHDGTTLLSVVVDEQCALGADVAAAPARARPRLAREARRRPREEREHNRTRRVRARGEDGPRVAAVDAARARHKGHARHALRAPRARGRDAHGVRVRRVAEAHARRGEQQRHDGGPAAAPHERAAERDAAEHERGPRERAAQCRRRHRPRTAERPARVAVQPEPRRQVLCKSCNRLALVPGPFFPVVNLGVCVKGDGRGAFVSVGGVIGKWVVCVCELRCWKESAGETNVSPCRCHRFVLCEDNAKGNYPCTKCLFCVVFCACVMCL